MTSTLHPPCAYGKYQLLERIGSGGMAEVYRARMPGLAGFSKTVVIKRLHPRYAGVDQYVQMFVDEAKLAAKVQHKNVVQVFELDSVRPGELHMALEWVDGIDLKRLLRAAAKHRRPVPPWLCVHIMCEVLEALAYAHDLKDDLGNRRNIVHCDVTPENIFLSRLGDVKLADFGVASDDTRKHSPFDGQVKGKVPYLSPEQISSEKPDCRADVFACGIVLWESLTLHRLFAAPTAPETMSRICMARRAPPSTLVSGIPPELDRAVLRALEPNVDHRTADARAFQMALLGVLRTIRPTIGLADVGDEIRRICGAETLDAPAAIPASLEIDVESAASTIEILYDVVEPEEAFVDELSDMIATLLPSSDVEPPPTLDQDLAEDETFSDAFDPSEDRTIAAFNEMHPQPDDGPDPFAVKRMAPPRDGLTYSIIKPTYAVDELGVRASEPIPMRGSPSVMETGDVIRPRPVPKAPIPAVPGRLNTRDVLERPVILPPGTLLLRTRGNRTLGPVGSLDVLGALADLLESQAEPDAEVSGDGYRWMPWRRFGELLGEAIVEAGDELPQHAFSGALENHSLASLFGELSRSHATGRLVLTRHVNQGLERREIGVHGGMLTGIASNQQHFATWAGLIDDVERRPNGLAEYVQQVATLAQPLWDIAPTVVVSAIASSRAQLAQQTLKQVFNWSVGQFTFKPTESPAILSASPVALLSVLPGIISRTKSPASLRATLMRLLDVRLERCARFDDDVGALRLQNAPLRVLSEFGNGLTLGESLARCATPEEEKIALVVAYLLVELSLVRPIEDVHHPSR